MPVERDLLQIKVKGEIMKGVLNFKIFIGISSYSQEFCNFSDSIILLISCVEACFHSIFGNTVLKLLLCKWWSQPTCYWIRVVKENFAI